MNLADAGLAVPAPIPFKWASTITYDPQALREIVEDVLTAGGLSVVYGESNSGKTTIMLDLAFRMTGGQSWLGKRVPTGAVLYIAAEGPNSVVLRKVAFCEDGGKVYAFGLISTSLALLDGHADVEDLLDLIRAKQTELLTGRLIELIIVDTVACSMPGADENSSEDMSRLIAACNRIRQETGAHVMLIHHAGKDASRGARGHSSLRGAVDTEIEVTDDGGGVHSLLITKQRDLGSKGLKLSCRFKPIEIATNQWGKPVTACVVVPVEEVSSHMAAILKQEADRHADQTVVDGFKRLRATGISPSDKPMSGDYLPQKLIELGFSNGLDRKALAKAMHNLMGIGVFKRVEIGRDTSRHIKYGLELVREL